MRIIHTADWHIGQTLAGYGREHEHRTVLSALAGLAVEHEADAMIVAGDIFDHQNPSGEAMRLYYETLVALTRARPSMTIVITAGNHDAAGRLEAPHALLATMGVHVVGSVRRLDGRITEPGRHLVPLPDASGATAAHVLAVSYPTAACLPPGHGFDVQGAAKALYDELFEATSERTRDLPLLVTGHLHVAGGTESEGAERRILVGGQHAVAPDIFPDAAAYVALGHLHKPQKVGRETIRYSGSLLPLSATELGYRHGVRLLTLDGSGITAGEHLTLPRPVEFLRLPADGHMRLDELGDNLAALGLPPDLPIDQRPFVQVRLSREGLPPGHRAEADRIAEAFPVRLVDLRLAPREEATAESVPADPGIRLAEIAPEDLFRKAYERQHGAPPTPAHLEAFHVAVAAAETEG